MKKVLVVIVIVLLIPVVGGLSYIGYIKLDHKRLSRACNAVPELAPISEINNVLSKTSMISIEDRNPENDPYLEEGQFSKFVKSTLPLSTAWCAIIYNSKVVLQRSSGEDYEAITGVGLHTTGIRLTNR